MRKLAAFTVSFALGICLAQYLLPERLLLPVAAVFFAAACLALLLPGLWRKRVLLVDDVITTGATAAACAQALLDAGAHSVFAVAMAVTENEIDAPSRASGR